MNYPATDVRDTYAPMKEAMLLIATCIQLISKQRKQIKTEGEAQSLSSHCLFVCLLV